MIGLKSVDQFEFDIHVLIDVIGVVEDYSTVPFGLDVKYHSADTPYPLCTFSNEIDIRGLAYGYTTILTSRQTSNVQFAQRTKEVRSFRFVNKTDANSLDMKEGGIEVIQM